MSKLTALQVKNVKTPGLINDGGGLYLRIAPGGSKSWVYRYRQNGRLRSHGLGSANTLSLAEARDKALSCRKMRLEGIDPIDAKKKRRIADRLAAAKAINFADCARQCIEMKRAGWKNAKHAAQWSATLERYVFPVFGDLPVADVDTNLILKVLEPIWTAKPETADRVRGRIEAVLDFAKAREYREGENPARWRGHLSLMLAARKKSQSVKHHAALPHTEIRPFWQQLLEQGGTGAQALRLTILTATRTSEVLAARWEEIDFEREIWTIPAERMKAGREHRIPLSKPALALLEAATALRRSELVFSGMKAGKPLSNMTMSKVLKGMNHPDITVHGFRSTFRDWTAECTDTPHEVAEATLAHTVSDKVVASYRRTDFFDKRRVLLEDWAGYIGA